MSWPLEDYAENAGNNIQTHFNCAYFLEKPFLTMSVCVNRNKKWKSKNSFSTKRDWRTEVWQKWCFCTFPLAKVSHRTWWWKLWSWAFPYYGAEISISKWACWTIWKIKRTLVSSPALLGWWIAAACLIWTPLRETPRPKAWELDPKVLYILKSHGVLKCWFSGAAGEKNMHDAEFTCALFRFIQLTCEGHNLGRKLMLESIWQKINDSLFFQNGRTTSERKREIPQRWTWSFVPSITCCGCKNQSWTSTGIIPAKS